MTVASRDARDAFALKVERGIFDPVARHLREDLRDDRLAEGVALTFEKYAKEAEQGVLLDDALLVHVCRLRATDLSRRVAGAGGCHPKRDVYDPRNKLELVPSEDVGYARRLRHDPTLAITSALDLGRWFHALDVEDQELLRLRARGDTLGEIGRAIGRSTSWVFARCKRLGEELAENAGIGMEERFAAAAE
jgi:hypothetical protein